MDEATALAQNLTFYSGDHFVIRADHTARLSAGGPGRSSVRLQSNKKYTTHVTVCVPPLPSSTALVFFSATQGMYQGNRNTRTWNADIVS